MAAPETSDPPPELPCPDGNNFLDGATTLTIEELQVLLAGAKEASAADDDLAQFNSQ